MNNCNTTNYIKKLVKIVYEKEKQIQLMKKTLKQRNAEASKQNFDVQIDRNIRLDLEYASTQMKQVNLHVLGMEKKVIDLENELQLETNKNVELQAQNKKLAFSIEQAKRVMAQQYESLVEFQVIVKELASKKQQCQNKLSMMSQLEKDRLEIMKDSEEKLSQKIQKMEKQIKKLKQSLKTKDTEIENISQQLDGKALENEILQNEIKQKDEEIIALKLELNDTNDKNTTLSNDLSLLKLQLQTLQDSVNMKEGKAEVLSESLKDYQQFAFQISQHIEAAYHKHCTQGKLRSSKKLIGRLDNCRTRFEFAFCKMNQIQLWMDSTAQKLEKYIKLNELPNQTLDNLSIIAESFEQKLELCDLTQRMEREKEELDKNEQMLLDNLQKEVEKSQLRDRTKLVELDEVREVLKVTKDINRELLNEINSKEYVISQCRKLYGTLIGNKSSNQYRHLKNLLNLRN